MTSERSPRKRRERPERRKRQGIRGRRAVGASLVMMVAACAPSGSVSGGAGEGEVAGWESSGRLTIAAARAAGLPAGVTFKQSKRTLGDGEPVRIHVLSVSPVARAKVVGAHGKTLRGSATVRQIASTAGAVAAVNGSFFDIRSGEHFGGYEGDPLGVYGTGGRLLSEAANGRTALILGGSGVRPRITELRSATTVTSSDGAGRTVDGINRKPGWILGCGGVGGDRLAGTSQEVTAPRQGALCTDGSEIIDFRPQWGATSPSAGSGSVEAVLDSRGRVTRLRTPAGGPIPAGGRTLVGTGKGATWLRAHAKTGRTLKVTNRVTDPAGRTVGGSGVTIIGAGPALVRDGRVWINAAANGYSDSALKSRHPRTVAGVKSDGTLLLVVMDGRWPGKSVGATFAEAARILVSLGAVDAVNLDGGGSSTVVVDGEVRNHPSGGHGSNAGEERKVSNAIVVVARN